jgi:hypothetical protein
MPEVKTFASGAILTSTPSYANVKKEDFFDVQLVRERDSFLFFGSRYLRVDFTGQTWPDAFASARICQVHPVLTKECCIVEDMYYTSEHSVSMQDMPGATYLCINSITLCRTVLTNRTHQSFSYALIGLDLRWCTCAALGSVGFRT